MLNALHLLARHRERDALVAALSTRAGAEDGNDEDDEDGQADGDKRGNEDFLQHVLSRAQPRILVCAPSNAAVDVLVARMLDKRCVDAAGVPYEPPIARLASEGTDTSAHVATVDAGKRAEAALAVPLPTRLARAEALTAELTALRRDLRRFRAAPPGEDARTATRPELLASFAIRYRRKAAELRALRIMADWGATSQQEQRGNAKERRERVEAALVEAAEIVFTTLGSSGRSLFTRAARRFDIVLIDEAAQATEVAALVALHHASCVVLVGDQRQLPATVLSHAARGCLYERSLFERLTSCGVASLMLTQQFRMHADICAFPSAHFYAGRLVSAPCIAARPPAPYHATPPLHAFAFFDVAQGSERRTPGSSSTQNTAEAELAVALYARLASVLSASDGAARGAAWRRALAARVGLVTPYKGQCEELKRVFAQRLGEGVLADLLAHKSINTVDGCQGSEREVIIFSAVRTCVSHGGGGNTRFTLGHVDDVQRMNVALTRAQHALWVLGRVEALAASPHWSRLVEHARRSGRLVRHPSAASLRVPAEAEPALR
jgi:senataxin